MNYNYFIDRHNVSFIITQLSEQKAKGMPVEKNVIDLLHHWVIQHGDMQLHHQMKKLGLLDEESIEIS